jgi:hypothetical protein
MSERRDAKQLKGLLDEELLVLDDWHNEQFREKFRQCYILHERLNDELRVLLERAPEGATIEEKMLLGSAIIVQLRLRNAVALLSRPLPPRIASTVVPEAEKVEELKAALRVLALWL